MKPPPDGWAREVGAFLVLVLLGTLIVTQCTGCTAHAWAPAMIKG